jgi:hypothetical protein
MNDCALTLSVSKTEDGELSRLPGGPTVLICCHPTKNAESLVHEAAARSSTKSTESLHGGAGRRSSAWR